MDSDNGCTRQLSREKGSDLDLWLIWASEQADRIDPLVDSPPSIIDEKAKHESYYHFRKEPEASEVDDPIADDLSNRSAHDDGDSTESGACK